MPDIIDIDAKIRIAGELVDAGMLVDVKKIPEG